MQQLSSSCEYLSQRLNVLKQFGIKVHQNLNTIIELRKKSLEISNKKVERKPLGSQFTIYNVNEKGTNQTKQATSLPASRKHSENEEVKVNTRKFSHTPSDIPAKSKKYEMKNEIVFDLIQENDDDTVKSDEVIVSLSQNNILEIDKKENTIIKLNNDSNTLPHSFEPSSSQNQLFSDLAQVFQNQNA